MGLYRIAHGDETLHMEDFDGDGFAILLFEFQIVACVFSEGHSLSNAHVRGRIDAVIAHASTTQRHDGAELLGFLLLRVGTDDTARRNFFIFIRKNGDTISKRFQFYGEVREKGCYIHK